MRLLLLICVVASASFAADADVSIYDVRARKDEFVGKRASLVGFLWVHPEETLLLSDPPPSDTEPDFRRSLYFDYRKMKDPDSIRILKELFARARRGEVLPPVRAQGLIVEDTFGFTHQKALGIAVERVSVEEGANQALQPTRMLVTFRACARPAPSTRVADL